MAKNQKQVLKAHDLKHHFLDGAARVDVLKGANLELFAGQMVALLGQSGAGKSTFLQIVGLLERPRSGQIFIDEQNILLKSDQVRSHFRLNKIGFVYQFHHLLPDFTALENVMLPQLIQGVSSKKARDKAAFLLEKVQLSHRLNHRPSELSGGEQQRVAIGRALVNDPVLVIADEPTGNLDPRTAEHVFSLFKEIVREQQIATLIATHNHDLAQKMDQIYQIQDGVIVVK